MLPASQQLPNESHTCMQAQDDDYRDYIVTITMFTLWLPWLRHNKINILKHSLLGLPQEDPHPVFLLDHELLVKYWSINYIKHL